MIPPRARLIAGFWLLLGAISTLQIQISMLSHGHSWARVLAYQELVWGVWIAYTFAIVALVRRVPLVPARPGPVIVHAVVAIVLGVTHLVIWVAAEFVLVPYDVMNPTDFGRRFRSLTIFQLPLELLLYGLVVLAHRADEASRLQRERERRAAQLEASLAQARLQALELQTQPHFLFNTLNGIAALVRGRENDKALAMIDGLSELLRYALDRGGGAVVALEEEARTVARYLEIQRIRFADRLAVEVRVGPDTRRAAIPALLLQPLAENAVRHGTARSAGPGRIVIESARAGADLVITIDNTGTLDAERRSGIGLSTTAARLAELHGGRARVELAAHDGGVRARVVLPYAEVP
jgi:two-component system, LytTR family, sensor kinase